MGKLIDLPTEILVEILSRLPTETVLECKVVCKPWRNLVSNPSFSPMHLTHLNNQIKLSFVYKSASNPELLRYFEYKESPLNEVTRAKLSPPIRFSNIIGSCSGLICLSGFDNDNSFSYNSICICNPIVKEFIILPEVKKRSQVHCVLTGFGYLPSSNEYKVVRVYRGESNFIVVDVYTLGSGNGWRNVADYGLDICFFEAFDSSATFFSGILYWGSKDRKIVAFDLADEKFYKILSPPRSEFGGRFSLGVLGGYLSAATCDSHFCEVWLYKKYNGTLKDIFPAWIWCEEFTLPDLRPLAFMKSGVVLCHDYVFLYSYDPKSLRSNMLPSPNSFAGRPIPHVNSFVSLKALGEEDTRMMDLEIIQ